MADVRCDVAQQSSPYWGQYQGIARILKRKATAGNVTRSVPEATEESLENKLGGVRKGAGAVLSHTNAAQVVQSEGMQQTIAEMVRRTHHLSPLLALILYALTITRKILRT